MPKRSTKNGRTWLGRFRDGVRAAIHRVRMLLWVVAFTAVAASVIAVAVGLDHLNAQVVAARLEEFPDARVEFVDVPAALQPLASDDLHRSVAGEFARPWTLEDACRRVADRVRSVGWVESVNSVHRQPDGRFLVGCRYRVPVAMVRHGGSSYLVDAAGVRLPGVYRGDGSTRSIEHVSHPPPPPGERWQGDDVQAGLMMLRVLSPEPFQDQITAIDVGNVGGRIDATASHIDLGTDQEGGQIRWGSVPGTEVEENRVEQKLGLLRANYRETGRADAHHAVIDVSTFPDRFTVPKS